MSQIKAVATLEEGDSPGADPRAEIERLQSEVAQLEDEINAVHTAIAQQESHLINGYIVNIRLDIGGGYAARCPTLRAVACGDSMQDVLANIRDSMETSIEGRQYFGDPIPPPDTTETTWPAWDRRSDAS